MHEHEGQKAGIEWGVSPEGFPRITFSGSDVSLGALETLQNVNEQLLKAGVADLRLGNATPFSSTSRIFDYSYTDYSSAQVIGGEKPFFGRLLAASYIPRVVERAENYGGNFEDVSSLVESSSAGFKGNKRAFLDFARLVQAVEVAKDPMQAREPFFDLMVSLSSSTSDYTENLDSYPAIIEFFAEHCFEYPKFIETLLRSRSGYAHIALLDTLDAPVRYAFSVSSDPKEARRIRGFYVDPLLLEAKQKPGEPANVQAQEHLGALYEAHFKVRQQSSRMDKVQQDNTMEAADIRQKILETFFYTSLRPLDRLLREYFQQHADSDEARLIVVRAMKNKFDFSHVKKGETGFFIDSAFGNFGKAHSLLMKALGSTDTTVLDEPKKVRQERLSIALNPVIVTMIQNIMIDYVSSTYHDGEDQGQSAIDLVLSYLDLYHPHNESDTRPLQLLIDHKETPEVIRSRIKELI